MLVEAIDRDAARRSIEERLRETEQRLNSNMKTLDLYAAHADFIENRLAAEPALQRAFENETNRMTPYKVQIEIDTVERDLLKRR